jgi:Domain of unknown function (DUF4185)
MKLFTTSILLFLLLCCKKKVQNTDVTEPTLKVYKDSIFQQFFNKTSGLIAGDVGFTIPLDNNKVIWLFGDSYIDNFDATTQTVPCLFQVNNAALVHNKNDLINSTTILGTQTGIKSLFKIYPDATNKKLWPGNGYLLNDSIYIYNQGIKINNTGNFGFNITGEDYIATLKASDLTVVNYKPLPFLDSVFYGSAIIKDDATNYVYAYGVKNNGLGSNVYIARFKADKPNINWEFYTGTTWSNNQQNKMPIAQGYSYSVHVSKIKNKYVLLTSYFNVGCNQGREIHSFTSSKPEGPFTNDKKIYDTFDSSKNATPFFYFPVSHPEFINSKDELLVTYSINGFEPCYPNCINGRMNPTLYRLQAIRVPLKIIDPSF